MTSAISPSIDTTAESLSVVIPFYNEAGNILPLLEEVQTALAELDMPWELIAVNDGSHDNTAQELSDAREELGEHICVVNFARNFGQTAAMQAGIEAANGSLIVTLDGDRQNDPNDIPSMIQTLNDKDLDMVCGWRKDRKDGQINRKLPSKIANSLIRRVTGVTISDYGCSLKLFRGSVIKQILLMGEMHRFIPAWVACVTDPQRIGEQVVNHRARTVGESKYGISRTFRVVIDLLSVLFFMRFSRRPGHFFGSIGLLLSGLGGLILTYLLGLKIFLGADVGTRPLLFVGLLFVISGIQMVCTGILAELQARSRSTYSPAIRNQSKVVRFFEKSNQHNS